MPSLTPRGDGRSWVLEDLSDVAEISLCGATLAVASMFEGLDAAAQEPPT